MGSGTRLIFFGDWSVAWMRMMFRCWFPIFRTVWELFP